ncbi:MAG: hypothetical protein WC365_04335 [Candidatus Babeliales bacterium]
MKSKRLKVVCRNGTFIIPCINVKNQDGVNFCAVDGNQCNPQRFAV